MKWIVLVIVAFIVIYTVVNIYFRKPGQPYRPYQDAQDRATTARLLNAGWQRVPLTTRRPMEKAATERPSASISRAAVGLGADLEDKFAEKPKLLASIDQVTAPAATTRNGEYAAYFTASLANLKTQVGEMTLYRKDHELVLIPVAEALPGPGLMSRWNDSVYWIEFPTASLPPGRYEMRIVAKGPAAAWSFEVR
jgi:hypothetical protein